MENIKKKEEFHKLLRGSLDNSVNASRGYHVVTEQVSQASGCHDANMATATLAPPSTTGVAMCV